MKKLPAKFRHVVFSGLLSGFMSLMVSGVATWLVVGLPVDFIAQWGGAWLPSWMIAFCAVLVVAPMVHKMTDCLVEKN